VVKIGEEGEEKAFVVSKIGFVIFPEVPSVWGPVPDVVMISELGLATMNKHTNILLSILIDSQCFLKSDCRIDIFQNKYLLCTRQLKDFIASRVFRPSTNVNCLILNAIQFSLDFEHQLAPKQ